MSERAESEPKLARAVARLAGQRCWGFAAGSGTGSVVSLSIGGMIPRSAPLRNPHLSTAVRENDPEFGLYVECVWRIERQDGIVAGCWDSNEEDGPMLKGLATLVDQLIVDAELVLPALDLKLRFANDVSFRIFCDQTNADDGTDNYTLFTPTETLIVGCRSAVRSERRGGLASV